MTGASTPALPGARPSPNIWHHTAVYEVENRAVDPDGAIEAAMLAVASWDGRAVLDVGCGTGFHLPAFARTASRRGRRGAARRPRGSRAARARRLPQVSVLRGRRRNSRSPTRPSTWRTPGGRTSSAPAAGPAWPSWRASYDGAERRSWSTTTPPGQRSGRGSAAGSRTWTRPRSGGSGRPTGGRGPRSTCAGLHLAR